MAVISTESFTADGTQKTFTVSQTILSSSHCRVHFYHSETDNPVADSEWDLLGQSTVVFNEAPTNAYIVKITISSDGSGLDDAPSDISDLSANISEILFLADNIDEVIEFNNNYPAGIAYYIKSESDARYEPIDATILKDADIGVNVLSPTGDGSSLTGISAGATGGGTDQVFYLNDQVITTDYTIPDGQNAMTAGSVTINDGVTVTIPSGSTWTIV